MAVYTEIGDDELIEMEVLERRGDILTVTERGYGKRTKVEEYRLQGRGGSGIINIRVTPKPLDAKRGIFSGSLEQIKEDVERVRALKADELFFDPTFSPDGESAESFMACMERIRKLW